MAKVRRQRPYPGRHIIVPVEVFIDVFSDIVIALPAIFDVEVNDVDTSVEVI